MFFAAASAIPGAAPSRKRLNPFSVAWRHSLGKKSVPLVFSLRLVVSNRLARCMPMPSGNRASAC